MDFQVSNRKPKASKILQLRTEWTKFTWLIPEFNLGLTYFDHKFTFDFSDECKHSRTKFIEWWKGISKIQDSANRRTSDDNTEKEKSPSEVVRERADEIDSKEYNDSLQGVTKDRIQAFLSDVEEVTKNLDESGNKSTLKQSKDNKTKSREKILIEKEEGLTSTEIESQNVDVEAAIKTSDEAGDKSTSKQIKDNRTKSKKKILAESEKIDGLTDTEIEGHLVSPSILVHASNLVEPGEDRKVRCISTSHVERIKLQLRTETTNPLKFVSMIGNLSEQELNRESLARPGAGKVEVIGGNHTRVALQQLVQEGRQEIALIPVRLYSGLSQQQCLRLGVAHNNIHEIAKPASFYDNLMLFRRQLESLIPGQQITAQIKKKWLREMAAILNIQTDVLKNRYKIVKQVTELPQAVWEAVEKVLEAWNDGDIKGQRGDIKPILFLDLPKIKEEDYKISLLKQLSEGQITVAQFKKACKQADQGQQGLQPEIHESTANSIGEGNDEETTQSLTDKADINEGDIIEETVDTDKQGSETADISMREKQDNMKLNCNHEEENQELKEALERVERKSRKLEEERNSLLQTVKELQKTNRSITEENKMLLVRAQEAEDVASRALARTALATKETTKRKRNCETETTDKGETQVSDLEEEPEKKLCNAVSESAVVGVDKVQKDVCLVEYTRNRLYFGVVEGNVMVYAKKPMGTIREKELEILDNADKYKLNLRDKQEFNDQYIICTEKFEVSGNEIIPTSVNNEVLKKKVEQYCSI